MSRVLEHDISDIIGRLIVSLGHGSEPTNKQPWPVFSVSQPDKVDSMICVFSTTGRVQDSYLLDGTTQEQYGFQIKVRSESIAKTRKKIADIVRDVDKVVRRQVLVDSSTYTVHACTRSSSILYIGFDPPENVFPVNVVNYTVTIT